MILPSVPTHGSLIRLPVSDVMLADHTSTSTGVGLMDIEGEVTRSEFGAVLGDTVVSGPFTIFKNSISREQCYHRRAQLSRIPHIPG